MYAHFLYKGGFVVRYTSYVQDQHLTIALAGEIDHHAAREVMRAVADKIDAYLPSLCCLDFREVTFMDSSGIAVVLNAIRRMRELGGNLEIKNVPAQPMRVLKTAGIEKLMELGSEAK